MKLRVHGNNNYYQVEYLFSNGNTANSFFGFTSVRPMDTEIITSYSSYNVGGVERVNLFLPNFNITQFEGNKAVYSIEQLIAIRSKLDSLLRNHLVLTNIKTGVKYTCLDAWEFIRSL